jgi:hypothetical protein
VGLNPTTTALSSTPNPSSFGQSVTLTATVAPQSSIGGPPTGTVTFYDGSTAIGSASVTASGSAYTASIAVSNLAIGSHSFTAAYGGSTAYNASTSAAVTQTVNKAVTTVVAEGGNSGGSMTAALSTSSGPLAGQTLTFRTGSTVLCSAVTGANGSATCSASGLNVLTLDLSGSYTVTYAGNADYQGSSATGKI